MYNMHEKRQIAEDYAKQVEAERILKEAAIEREKQAEMDSYLAKDLLKEAALKKRENFFEYKSSVKKALLTEALRRIYVGSIKNPSPHEKKMCESLLDNYINERGAESLISGFHGKTSFLENLEGTIEKYYQIMTEDADPENPQSMGIDRENLDDFFKEIDKTEDIEDITNTIRLRVANAEEEFVVRNEEDKNDIDTILKDTSDRVQNDLPDTTNTYSYSDDTDYTNGDNGEADRGEGMHNESAELKKRAVMDARQKIYETQNARSRNVFDRIVRNMSEAVIKDPVLRESYAAENGRLNIDSIVESARCMYTLLEMVSTLRIEDVNAEYVEDTIRSIH